MDRSRTCDYQDFSKKATGTVHNVHAPTDIAEFDQILETLISPDFPLKSSLATESYLDLVRLLGRLQPNS